MQPYERAEAQLILDHEGHRARLDYERRLVGLQFAYKAEGQTAYAPVRVAVRAAEELASLFIAKCIDQVATVARDDEAFSIIDEAVGDYLNFLGGKVEDIAEQAGRWQGRPTRQDFCDGAKSNFFELAISLRGKLKACRLVFIEPNGTSLSPPPIPEPTFTSPRNRGGKPLARHWDEMWAAIAAMLFAGDLQPKSQADIERAMMDWFADKDLDVGVTAIRGRARPPWQRLQQAE